MAGCFGNSPFDRYMENELFRHLDEEAEFDNWCEELLELVQVDISDETLNLLFNRGLSPQEAAKEVDNVPGSN